MAELSGEQLVEVALECMEACVHYVLCARGLYPARAFEACRLYGVVLYKCRHPDVCSYVHEALQSLKSLLFVGALVDV